MKISQSTTGEILFTLSHRRQALLESIQAKMHALDPRHPMYKERLALLQAMERDAISTALRSPASIPRRSRGR